MYLLDTLQCLQSAEARHLFIEQYQVEVPFSAEVDGVGTVAHRHNVVTLALQEQPLGLQLLYLIIYPK